MSPPWPEELLVGLAPDGVQFLRTGRMRRRETGYLRAAPPWREALGALAGARPRAPCRVVLSNHFLRHDLLPWDAGLAAPAERIEQARVRMRGVHGPVAEEWALGVDEEAYGMAALACAVDLKLLEEIARSLGRPPRSCQPYAAAAFNRWRRVLKASAFRFAVLEPGRLWLGRAARGRWTGVLTRRLGVQAAAEAVAALAQEEALAGTPPVPGFAVAAGLGDAGLRQLEQAGLRVLQAEAELPLCLA